MWWISILDEENRYVVGNEVGVSYVALSYVWDETRKMPKLMGTTENRFRQGGSLTRETVLSTVDDTMDVTSGLGEKYIWVDCLCIMQDDESDRLEFIPKMHLIYGFASSLQRQVTTQMQVFLVSKRVHELAD